MALIWSKNLYKGLRQKNRSSFGYKLELKQQIDETPMTTEMQFVVPGSVSDEKIEYMEDFGFEYINNDEPDVRESVFNSFATKSIPLGQKDYSSIYRSAFESFNKSVVEMLMTDPDHPDGDSIPNGYKFGYVPENLTADDFVYYNPDGTTPYNLDESEKSFR